MKLLPRRNQLGLKIKLLVSVWHLLLDFENFKLGFGAEFELDGGFWHMQGGGD